MNREFLKSNIYEIKKSGSLRTLGAVLGLFHLLLFYIWWDQGHLPLKFVKQGVAMCYPIFDNCDWMHILPFGVVSFFFYAYAVVMVIATALLLITEFVTPAYYLMLAGFFFGFVLYFQDLRLSSNEGYFLFLSTFAYLFVPSKHRLMRWLFVSFFAALGLSQASPDWLGGSWYKEHLNVPIKLAEWLSAMSVLIQMIGGACLIFRDGRYFWTGWISLFFFGCFNLYMGELLASSILLGALLYLALDELEIRKSEREYIYQSFIRPEPSFIWGGILLGLFWLAQLNPYLHISRNSTLKTVLSIWTLHPQAAHEDCEQKTYAVYKSRIEEIEVEPQMQRQPALYCNAYMRFLDLKAMCEQLRSEDPEFVTLSSVLQVRNFREKNSYRAFEVKDFCDSKLTFKRLGEVRWNTSHDK
jgi:hypothetical protein